jgi:hypothetical protein
MSVLVFLRGGRPIMMAAKERNFSPLKELSLEELVPKDNLYHRRSLVRAGIGQRWLRFGQAAAQVRLETESE